MRGIGNRMQQNERTRSTSGRREKPNGFISQTTVPECRSRRGSFACSAVGPIASRCSSWRGHCISGIAPEFRSRSPTRATAKKNSGPGAETPTTAVTSRNKKELPRLRYIHNEPDEVSDENNDLKQANKKQSKVITSEHTLSTSSCPVSWFTIRTRRRFLERLPIKYFSLRHHGVPKSVSHVVTGSRGGMCT